MFFCFQKRTVKSLCVIKKLRSINNFSSSSGDEAARTSYIKNGT